MGAPTVTDRPCRTANPDFQGIDLRLPVSGRVQPQLPGRLVVPALPQRDADVGQRGAPARSRGGVRELVAGALPESARERVPVHRAAPRRRQAVRLHQRLERMGGRGAPRAGPRATATPTCRRPPTRCGDFPVAWPRADRRSCRTTRISTARSALALTLARTLVGAARVRVEILLCGDGPLRREFETVGRVHDFSRPAMQVPKLRPQHRPGALTRGGARIALCNTSVVGEHGRSCCKTRGFTRRVDDSRAARAHRASTAWRLDRGDCDVRRPDRVPGRGGARSVRRADRAGAVDKAVVRPQGCWRPTASTDVGRGAAGLLRDRARARSEATIALGVGFADHRKGIDLFVDVGLTLLGTMPDARRSCGSATHEAATSAAAQRAHHRGRLRGPFPVSRAVSPTSDLFFAGADVYLMTSREDPFPARGAPRARRRDTGGWVRGCRRVRRAAAARLRRPGAVSGHRGDGHSRAARAGRPADERDRLTAAGRTIVDREFDFVSYARFLVRARGARRTDGVGRRARTTTTRATCPRGFDSILDADLSPARDHLSRRLLDGRQRRGRRGLLRARQIPYRIIRNETNQGCLPPVAARTSRSERRPGLDR